jgi:hypothetical protein
MDLTEPDLHGASVTRRRLLEAIGDETTVLDFGDYLWPATT